MIGFIIYFTGFLASWFLIRWIQNQDSDSISWEQIIWRFVASLCSWITVFAICIILVVAIIIIAIIELSEKTNPPKWLQ